MRSSLLGAFPVPQGYGLDAMTGNTVSWTDTQLYFTRAPPLKCFREFLTSSVPQGRMSQAMLCRSSK